MDVTKLERKRSLEENGVRTTVARAFHLSDRAREVMWESDWAFSSCHTDHIK